MLAVRALLKIFLGEFNFEFVEASTGLEGFGVACTKLPQLIISDIQMPVMGGLEMLEQVRAVPTLREVPIIVLSADEQQLALLTAQNAPFTYVALKPIDPNILKAVVRRALKL